MSDHHDSHEQPYTSARGDEADPPSGVTAFVGVIGVLLIVATVIGLDALYQYEDYKEVQTKKYEETYRERVRLQAEQRENIEQYAVNKETGAVQIPIEDAMRLVLKDLKTASE
ncbi:MAG: hypothetical protein AB7N71_10365 [Phycisphaerae bacterium]